MSAQMKQLGKHTLVYTAGIVLGRVASFIMLPVYTRYLTPADYGVLELLGMTIEVIGMITGAGIVAGVFKFYSEENDQSRKDVVISTAALSVVGLAAVTSLFGLALAPQLSTLIFDSEANTLYLRLHFLIYLFQNFEFLPLLLIRAENRSVLFVVVNAAKLIAMLSLNILFVVQFRMGIQGVLTSNVIVSAVVAIGLTTYMVRRVGITFSGAKFREMVRFGISIVLWSLSSFVLVFSDRFFLNYYTSTSTVGIYSLAYKFAFLVSVLAYTPFDTVWTAHRFEIAKQPNAREVYAKVFLYMNVVLGCVGLVLCLYIRDVLSVMSDPAFLPAHGLVPLLVAAQIVFVWAAYWNTGIYISGKTKSLATGAIVLVVVTLIINFALIPRFGSYGAAWATIVAYTCRFLWIHHFAQRDYRIAYRWTEMLALYGIFAAGIGSTFIYRPSGLPASLGWSTLVLAICLYMVYALVLSPEDRTSLAGFARAYMPRSMRGQPSDGA